MKLVRFDAPAGHRLIAYGDEILGGQTVEMSDAEAERLAADPHITVTVTVTVSDPSQEDRVDPQSPITHEEE